MDLIPTQPIPPERAIIFKGQETTGLSMWPEKIAMALYDFKATKKTSSWTTYEVALRDFFQFLALLGLKSPADVERTHLTSYVDYLRKEGKADRTIRLYCSAASSFFDFLARPFDTHGTALIQSNPWKGIKDALPKVNAYERKTTHRELNEEEYRRILETCDRNTVVGKRDYAILATTFWTTRRRQEIARILVRDFEVQGGKAFIRFIQKGGKPIDIDITPGILAAIKDYWTASKREIKHDSPAWVGSLETEKEEQPISPWTLDAMIKRRGLAAKIDENEVDIHMHGLRHLGARTMKAMGKSLKDIKERLGHASLATTDIYLGSMNRVSSDGMEDYESIALGKK